MDIAIGRKFETSDLGDKFTGEIVYISDEKDEFRDDYVACVRWVSTITGKAHYDNVKISNIKENLKQKYYRWVN